MGFDNLFLGKMNIILCKYGILFPMGDIYSFFIICLIIFEAKKQESM